MPLLRATLLVACCAVPVRAADVRVAPPAVTLSGNFARDMTYSIAWALFALMLLMIGFHKRVPGVRYASLGLLSLTLLKLFDHPTVAEMAGEIENLIMAKVEKAGQTGRVEERNESA